MTANPNDGDGFNNIGGEFYAGTGNDIAGGSNDGDKIYGGAGNDILTGGANDILLSGSGTAADPYSFKAVNTSTGDDYLNGGSESDALHGFDGDDQIYGGGGNDSGQVPGFGGWFLFFDGKPNAGLYGGTGDDRIDGGAGDDDLFGGEDDDHLSGGGGKDNLYGEGGTDNMIGGRDADTFFVGARTDELDGDRIGDFDRREHDTIDVSAIDARPGGIDNRFDYVGKNRFDEQGQISFKNGKLKFNLDDDSGAEAVVFVNTNKLTGGDIEL